jgi:hypothetical protein
LTTGPAGSASASGAAGSSAARRTVGYVVCHELCSSSAAGVTRTSVHLFTRGQAI